MKFFTKSGTRYEVYPTGEYVLTPTGVSEEFTLKVYRTDGEIGLPWGRYPNCHWLAPLQVGFPASIATRGGSSSILTSKVTLEYYEVEA